MGVLEGVLTTYLLNNVGVGSVVQSTITPDQPQIRNKGSETFERKCPCRGGMRAAAAVTVVVAVIVVAAAVVVIAVIIVHHHLPLLPGHLRLPIPFIFPFGQSFSQSRQVHGMFDNVEIARGTSSIDGMKEGTNTAIIWWVGE